MLVNVLYAALAGRLLKIFDDYAMHWTGSKAYWVDV